MKSTYLLYKNLEKCKLQEFSRGDHLSSESILGLRTGGDPRRKTAKSRSNNPKVFHRLTYQESRFQDHSQTRISIGESN